MTPDYFENFDLHTVTTPIDTKKFKELLEETNYCLEKTKRIIDTFVNGFSLECDEFAGEKRYAPNLKLRIGNETILWNKVMKEVGKKHFAGPYKEVPYEHFVQSLIGLVSKDDGRDARLIFHLSYPRSGKSINSTTPKNLSTVTYPDFDEVVKLCIRELTRCEKLGINHLYIGKSDMTSAFRNLGMKILQFRLLVMKARLPINGQWYYFIDKCLPFGASISCAHFQEFSNAVAHIIQVKIQIKLVNYLDDFLFVAAIKIWCDGQIKAFIEICDAIKVPISKEKTFWGEPKMTFLGLLLDS